MKRILILLLAAVFLFPLISSGSTENREGQKPTVAVSILPHQWAVDRIGGDLIDSLVLVGQGQSPHSYEPTPRQMASLSAASLWFTSGTDFEAALKPNIRAIYPSLTIIDGTGGVTFRHLEAHAHEEEGEDEEEESIDPHTWLGSEAYLIFIDHVQQALSEIDPGNASFFAGNAKVLKQEIIEEFESLRRELAPLEGSVALVFHPSFGYFLDEFGIIQEAIETGGKEPTARILSEIITEAKAEGVNTIFVQKQFPVEAARTIAQTLGAQVVPLDPLAYEWLENIRNMGQALKGGL